MHYISRYIRRPRRKKKKKIPLRGKILILLILFIVFAVFSEIGIQSVSQELTEEAAKKYIVTAVNDAVKKVVRDEEEFINITRDNAGKVISTETNTAKLNILKADLSNEITKRLNGRGSVGIPIGSFTDVGILNGRGFAVPVKLNYTGTAELSFQTEFVSAGINQSCHRITLTVHSSVVSQSQKFKANVENETNVVIAETVIVGAVPNLMTDFD